MKSALIEVFARNVPFIAFQGTVISSAIAFIIGCMGYILFSSKRLKRYLCLLNKRLLIEGYTYVILIWPWN